MYAGTKSADPDSATQTQRASFEIGWRETADMVLFRGEI
jgi:hypothetical protein